MYNNMISSDRDVHTAVDGCKLAARIGETSFRQASVTMERTPLAGCTEFEQGKDECWKRTVRLWLFSVCNPPGTCKMDPPSTQRR
jgi:hypothetical protein